MPRQEKREEKLWKSSGTPTFAREAINNVKLSQLNPQLRTKRKECETAFGFACLEPPINQWCACGALLPLLLLLYCVSRARSQTRKGIRFSLCFRAAENWGHSSKWPIYCCTCGWMSGWSRVNSHHKHVTIVRPSPFDEATCRSSTSQPESGK